MLLDILKEMSIFLLKLCVREGYLGCLYVAGRNESKLYSTFTRCLPPLTRSPGVFLVGVMSCESQSEMFKIKEGGRDLFKKEKEVSEYLAKQVIFKLRKNRMVGI